MYEYLRQIYDFYGAYGYYPYSRPYGEYDPFPYAYLSSYYYSPYPYACCEPYPYQDPCCDQNPCCEPFPGPFGYDTCGCLQPQEAFIW